MKKYYQKNKIELPEKGRRFAIGDIHGCYATLKYLVENKIKLKKKDQLFLLGDYINKGPKSKKTLNYILKLIDKGYGVYPLRGNHEDELLDAAINEPRVLGWLCRKSPELLKAGKVRKKHLKFIESMPFYYELSDFFLVHGGFNFKIDDPLKDKNAMLWRRMPETTTSFGGNKIILHAHRPQSIETIKERVRKKAKIIGLDNGVCYTKGHKYYDYTKMGNLCALNLDTFELLIAPNIEDPIKNTIKRRKIRA